MKREDNKALEKAIKKGKRISSTYKINTFIGKIIKPSKGKAIMIDTKEGPARVLTYGFEDTQVKPVFFSLHGGGFVLGSPEMDEHMNLAFVASGQVKLMSIDYAKAPDKAFPSALNQINQVISHVLDKHDTYKIDPKAFAIGGHSAGGNLSLAVTLKRIMAKEQLPKCVILDYPPLDIATDPYEKACPKGAIPPSVAVSFNACYVQGQNAKNPLISPVFASDDLLEKLPASLFILPGRDSLYEEGKQLYQKIESLGNPVRVYEYPDQKHGFTLNQSPEALDAIGKMSDFMNEYLLG